MLTEEEKRIKKNERKKVDYRRKVQKIKDINAKPESERTPNEILFLEGRKKAAQRNLESIRDKNKHKNNSSKTPLSSTTAILPAPTVTSPLLQHSTSLPTPIPTAAVPLPTSTSLTHTSSSTVLSTLTQKESSLRAFDFFHQHTIKYKGFTFKYKVHQPKCECRRIMNHIFGCDGLTVVPDNYSIHTQFICPDTNSLQCQTNQLATETFLRNIIFSEDHLSNLSKIKVSCAKCMLSHIPNGVACIVHQNKDKIESVIDESEKLKNSKEQLHHDHAQFLLPVQVCDLRNERSYWDEINSKGYSIRTSRRHHYIFKGHHLRTMLTLSLEKKLNILDSHFILTMFSLRDNKWTLDLPGGKRHLGEDTFDCMIRETEEETSVKIEKWWIKHDVSFESNCYFVIEPNDNLILNFSLKNQSSDIKNKLGLNSSMDTENENKLDFFCNIAATYI